MQTLQQQILAENIFFRECRENLRTVRDRETGRRIDTEQTYEQAMVYASAELLIYE